MSALLLLVPATLFAQIGGRKMSGVVQPRLAMTTTGAALAWAYGGVYVTMDVTRGPVEPENQLLLGAGRNPSIASDGENVLVVWSSGDVGRPRQPRLRAALVNGGGIVGAPFDLAASDTHTAPAVVWNGTNYVIAWHDPNERGLRTAMVDRFGNFPGQVNDVIDKTTDYRVAIASAGDRSLIVTADSLVVVDNGALPLAQTSGGGDDVTWDGSDYFVVLADATGISGMRVSRNGNVVAGATSLTNDQGRDPRVAWNGREIEVLWLAGASVRIGRIGEDGVFAPGDVVWSGPVIGEGNFDIAARASGQTIIAKGPSALAAGITFDIVTLRRRVVVVTPTS